MNCCETLKLLKVSTDPTLVNADKLLSLITAENWAQIMTFINDQLRFQMLFVETAVLNYVSNLLDVMLSLSRSMSADKYSRLKNQHTVGIKMMLLG